MHCGRVTFVDDAGALFGRTFGAGPGRDLVGPRTGQPHRRAHRLQRRPRPADRPAPAHVCGGAAARPRPAEGGQHLGPRRGRRRRAGGHRARQPAGLGRLPRGGLLGAAARRGMRFRGSTSRSPATFRSGPGCRARRPSSARSSPRSPTCSDSTSSPTTPAAPGPRDGASAPRTRSPGRRPAGWTRPRRCGRRRTTRSSSTAGPGAVEQVPVGRVARSRPARRRHPRGARPRRRSVRRTSHRLRGRRRRSWASRRCARWTRRT